MRTKNIIRTEIPRLMTILLFNNPIEFNLSAQLGASTTCRETTAKLFLTSRQKSLQFSQRMPEWPDLALSAGA
jgi:hypothetical protein